MALPGNTLSRSRDGPPATSWSTTLILTRNGSTTPPSKRPTPCSTTWRWSSANRPRRRRRRRLRVRRRLRPHPDPRARLSDHARCRSRRRPWHTVFARHQGVAQGDAPGGRPPGDRAGGRRSPPIRNYERDADHQPREGAAAQALPGGPGPGALPGGARQGGPVAEGAGRRRRPRVGRRHPGAASGPAARRAPGGVKTLAGHERVGALQYGGEYFDVGPIPGWLKTSIALARARPEFRDEIEGYLRRLLDSPPDRPPPTG